MNPKEMTPKQGHLFIISGPSGAGKTTLSRAILERFADMLYSVSYTTRPPRNGERDGIDYHFISREAFRKNIERGCWSEWAEVHGNYYGTSAEFIEKNLSSGIDILLDIDVQGTVQILKQYPDSVTIFVLPPTMESLRKRLEMRGTESKAVLDGRFLNAKKEISRKNLYRHVIVNDQLSLAIEKLISIIEGYRDKITKEI